MHQDAEFDLQSTSCCGLGEIEGLSSYTDPEDFLIHLLTEVDDHYDYDKGAYTGKPMRSDTETTYAHILFTEAVAKGARKASRYGLNLANYIQKNNLGTVVQTAEQRRNPNSGNLISAFLWTPNQKGIAAWYKRMLKEGKLGEEE